MVSLINGIKSKTTIIFEDVEHILIPIYFIYLSEVEGHTYKMITLRSKLKKEGEIAKSKDASKRISVRDQLLVKEVGVLISSTYLLALSSKLLTKNYLS